MNKQPYYHDIQATVSSEHEEIEISQSSYDTIHCQLSQHINEAFANHRDCALVEDTLEVVGYGSELLQILFVTTNGFEPASIYDDIKKIIADNLNSHNIRVEVLSAEPEVGNPHDLM